jgi:hypothetical protein
MTRTPKTAINDKKTHVLGWVSSQTQNGTVVWNNGGPGLCSNKQHQSAGCGGALKYVKEGVRDLDQEKLGTLELKKSAHLRRMVTHG